MSYLQMLVSKNSLIISCYILSPVAFLIRWIGRKRKVKAKIACWMSFPLITHNGGHFILPTDSKKNSSYTITKWRLFTKDMNSPKHTK